jgi:hypothetical protein
MEEMALHSDWVIKMVDLEAAFLTAPVDTTDVYIELPEGLRPFLTVRQNKNKTGRTNLSVVVLSDLQNSSPAVANQNNMIFTNSNEEISFTLRTHVLETCFVVPKVYKQMTE